ncbi:hypothetical protein IAU59_001288 [Kwoniella sp. CBS 9459]
MFFSLKTIALVASTGLLASQGAQALAVEERANSLCNQPNYGASGAPWNPNSAPGSFCSSNKPSNNRYWRNLPFWDGGDRVRCSGSQRGRYNVCNGGNRKSNLPKKCNPPHRGRKTTTVAAATSTKAAASSAAAVSSAAVSSAAGAASSAVASSAADPAITAPVTASATSSAAGSSATGTDPNPYADPVCELSYQVQYQNYTRVAANGVWMGLTMGAATQDASYMTYTLSTSVDDCLRACDQIEGCVFVNTYYDVNEEENYLPKHADGVLTCAMFSTCVSTDKNDNWGGQDDPNTIVNSNGYCKSGSCSS